MSVRQEMTGKERILGAMKRQEVDYVPCCPFMNFQDWNQRMGKKWQYPFGPSLQETLDYMVNGLGVDQIIQLSMGFYPESGVTYKITVEDDIIHKTWFTPSGELHASVKYNEQWPHGIDIPFISDYNPAHFIEPWIKTMKDVQCFSHIYLPPSKSENIEKIRLSFAEMRFWAELYKLPLCLYCGNGLTGALNTFGPTALAEFTITDPELVDAYLEVDHKFNIKCYEVALDCGIDFIRRNGFYESCDFYSPDMLEHFLLKRLLKEIEIVHQAGKPIGYTLLTGIMPMLDYLKKLNFDSLICPDIFFKNADGTKINKELGGEKSFWAGPSDTIHLPFDKPEEVRKAVRKVFETFGKRGLILTPCSSSKAVFPWSNIIAMIEVWKNLR
ncbi:MAG: uroporphyrinogen decarboxylase family protein [Victivallaceae bacterium]|nr:uroporphyrinogen decarboxylase family protein [Victivallaceae bacterium]